MNAERYQAIQQAFLRIRELSAEDQNRRLSELEDAAMACEVRALLKHDSDAENLLRHADRIASEPTETLLLDRDVDVGETRNEHSSQPSNTTSKKNDQTVDIGAYSLKEVLGQGGFGTVYRAVQHEPIRREVAIKLINPGMDSDAVLRRFEAERQTLASLNHPGIASVYDAGTTQNGEPYFVMELVPGVPIDAYCQQRELETVAIVSLVEQAAEAVHHAHLRGVLHRDIKPSNVLVFESDEGDARVKVIDFGISKALHRRPDSSNPVPSKNGTDRSLGSEVQQSDFQHAELTGHGQLLGTLEYMSPEQLVLESNELDTRTDVYSLGALLYRLLCGKPPIPREQLLSGGISSLHRKLTDAQVERPFHSERSDDLGWVTMKAIEKDREDRYATMHDFLQDMRHFQVGEAVTARPASLEYGLRILMRRHRGFVIAACLLLVTFVTGLIGTISGYRNAIVARDGAVEEYNRAESVNRKLEAALYRNRIEQAWKSLRNGDSIAAADYISKVSSPQQGIEWRFVTSKLRRDDQFVVEPGGPAARDLDWCPRTRRLLRVLDDGSLVVSTRAGKDVWNYRHPSGCISACWCDGEVFVGCHGGLIIRLADDGKELARSTWPPRGGVYDLECIPSDGATPAKIAACFGDSGVSLCDAKSLSVLHRWSTRSRLKSIAIDPSNKLLMGCGYDDRLHLLLRETSSPIEVVDKTGHDVEDGVESWSWLDQRSGVAIGRKTWRVIQVDSLLEGGNWANTMQKNPLPEESVGVAVHALGKDSAIAGTSDGRILECRTGDALQKQNQWRFRSAVRSMAVTDDGESFYVAMSDGSIRLIGRMSVPATSDAVYEPGTPFTSGTSVNGGQQIATLDANGILSIWNHDFSQRVEQIRAHETAGWEIVATENRLVTLGDDRRLICREFPSLHTVWEQQIGWGVRHALFVMNGRQLVSAPPAEWNADEGTLAIYDADGEVIGRLAGHGNWVLRIASNEKGDIIATAGEDREIIIWDLRRREILHRLISPKHSAAEHLAFDERDDGVTALFSGHRDGTVLRWNLNTGDLEQTISAFGSAISGLEVVNDRLVVTSSSSSKLKFFDRAEGKLVAEFQVFDRPVELLRVSRDGNRLWLGNPFSIQMHKFISTSTAEDH